jgi:tRNA (mo5U34)-methyltransferase
MNIREEIAKVKWFHRIDLGGGVTTPGYVNSMSAKQLGIEDLSGKSVLDIGAWDGFYSFQAERCGARRVLATDSFIWSGGGGWKTGKSGFELARRVLKSKVEDKTIDVMDLSPEGVGVFDVVLFLGVLYHLRHPLLALERIAGVTGELLVLETQVDAIHYPRPAMVFYPERELADDATNWWGPNPAAVEAMLRTVGFRDVRMIEMYVPEKGSNPWVGPGQLGADEQGRAVFHARR